MLPLYTRRLSEPHHHLLPSDPMNRPEPIRTKRQFVKAYQANRFGNRAPTWDSLYDFRREDYRGLVHIRNRVAGGPTYYDLPPEDVRRMWYKLLDKGVQGDSLYLSGMAPHIPHSTIQGEVRTSERHLDLTYTWVKKPMRDALREKTLYASGILANSLLRNAMDPSSYDWVQELLDLYPEHVIEFSCFSVYWGTIPNRNCVIWEVRQEAQGYSNYERITPYVRSNHGDTRRAAGRDKYVRSGVS